MYLSSFLLFSFPLTGKEEIEDFLNKQGTPESLKCLGSRKLKKAAVRSKVFNTRRLLREKIQQKLPTE